MVQLDASTFEFNEALLSDLLGDIHMGQVQLPDFQRGWGWDDKAIGTTLSL